MNIFFIHENPVISAMSMTDKHVVKMIIESAQLMSTAHRLLDGKRNIIHVVRKSHIKSLNCHYELPEDLENVMYKLTHQNHPSAIWTRSSAHNYMWLYQHFIALCNEYTRRYNRTHLTYTKLHRALRYPPKNIPVGTFTYPPQAMPNIYKHSDTVIAYRKYYTAEKLSKESDIKRYNFYTKLDDYLERNLI
jgi:hypothetical protein